MALWDLLRRNGGDPALYRRQWSETSDPLVAEARSQTLAIQQLQLWLRLAYSALALAVLLGYWGLSGRQHLVLGIAGSVLAVLFFAVVVVLRTGIRNGRRNVEAMLKVLEGERDITDSEPNAN